MATVTPFKALRPPKDKVEAVACPPYDVVNEHEAREFAGENPFCFLRVTRPEIEFGEGTDPHCEAVYARAASNLQKFRREGTLAFDETPALFIYRQKMGDHAQSGVVGLCSVDEYDNDTIKKHEKTRPDKEDDRTRHILRTRSQYGPVFTTYRDHQPITGIMNAVMEDEPIYDFADDCGVQHTVWRVDATDERCGEMVNAFAEVPAFYIADGHHRAKSASRARAEFAKGSTNHTGEEAYNRYLSVLFPASQLQILPYNRVVLSLHGERPNEVFARIEEGFKVTKLNGPEAPPPGCFSVYMFGKWYGFRSKTPAPADPIAALDASRVQAELLTPMFGIDDPRTDQNLEFVGGVHGPEVLMAKADVRGGAAILMHPTRIEDVLAVSDAGGVMPPKSTWFEPKLRSGLIVHAF